MQKEKGDALIKRQKENGALFYVPFSTPRAGLSRVLELTRL